MKKKSFWVFPAVDLIFRAATMSEQDFQLLEEHADDEGEQQTATNPGPKPTTKADLYRAYSGRGPIQMFSDLIHDRQLQVDALIITSVSQPLEAMYAEDLEEQKNGSCEFEAQRAAGGEASWWGHVGAILMKVHNAGLMRRLGLTQRVRRPVTYQLPWAQLERETLEAIWNFATELAANLAWSQLLYKYTLPHSFAVLASDNPVLRSEGMELLKSMVECLREALRASAAHGDPALQDAIFDVAWHRPLAQTRRFPVQKTVKRKNPTTSLMAG